jgi:hypothetical protein
MVWRASTSGRVVGLVLALACIGAAKSTKSQAPTTPTAVPCSPLLLPSMAPTTRGSTPIPDAEQQAKLETTIRQTFKDDYAAHAPGAKLILARRLLQEGIDTDDDPAARYVLWRESRDLAAFSGDAPLASRALSRLSDQFTIDLPSSTLATLVIANRSATTPIAFAQVAHSAILGMDQSLALEDYDTATRLSNLAVAAAEKSKNPTLLLQAQARSKEVGAMAGQIPRYKSALTLLAEKPNDPDANLTVGTFLCFARCDWDKGLPHLAKSSDPVLKLLAQADLDASEPLQYHHQGTAWWDHAQTRSGLAHRHTQAHAVALYRKALPNLHLGLNLDSARKRIEEFEAQVLKELALEPGLLAEIHKGTDFGPLLRTRIDREIDFDWGLEAPEPGLPRDNFSIRWTGTLHLPETGRYELTLIANAGAKVYLGDKLVLDGSEISRKPKGFTIPADFNGALTPVRIDYWDTSGLAKIRLLWKTPGSPKEEPIPPSAFYHDTSANPAK